jgi:GTP diphosphokinase / guanosine-3',5'-bis(diphosphate) 3'-diphosphatase
MGACAVLMRSGRMREAAAARGAAGTVAWPWWAGAGRRGGAGIRATIRKSRPDSPPSALERDEMTDVERSGELLRALGFAAHKHRDQRRKDPEASPYVNHAIEVAEVLVRVGRVAQLEIVQAALLHDTIEDTDTTGDEIEHEFGPEVRRLVEAVTDDKRLPKAERKRLQIEHAPELCDAAKQIKLADKICNVRDVSYHPPTGWSLERRAEYLVWSRRVADGCRGVNGALDAAFDAVHAEGAKELGQVGI